MAENSSSFFQNRACKWFPCHKGVAEEEFNCLFCFCPLYSLGRDCGGKFEILESGVKSCMGCTVPHRAENYALVMQRVRAVLDRTNRLCREQNGGGADGIA